MAYNREKHHRRSIRLRDWDYADVGAYFVTICAYQQECQFGGIDNNEMHLNELGAIADSCWQAIPDHYANVEIDMYVVMPNHVHGVIVIVENVNKRRVGAQHAAPLPPSDSTHDEEDAPRIITPGSLGAIVRSYKSAVTRAVNLRRGMTGVTIWQRNYYETIIRNDRHLQAVREYIRGNPANWEKDEYYL